MIWQAGFSGNMGARIGMSQGGPHTSNEEARSDQGLQKDSHRRLHDIADARIEIEDSLAAPAPMERAAPVEEVRAGWRKPLLWGVASLVLAAIAGLAV